MTTETISIVSILATATFGIAGIAVGFLTARGQRLHAERLASQSFFQKRRGDAYAEILEAVRRTTQGIQQQGAVMQWPDTPGPRPIEPETLTRIDALVALWDRSAPDSLERMVRGLLAIQRRDDGSTVPNEERMRRPYPTKEMREAMSLVVAAENAIQEAAPKDLAGRS